MDGASTGIFLEECSSGAFRDAFRSVPGDATAVTDSRLYESAIRWASVKIHAGSTGSTHCRWLGHSGSGGAGSLPNRYLGSGSFSRVQSPAAVGSLRKKGLWIRPGSCLVDPIPITACLQNWTSCSSLTFTAISHCRRAIQKVNITLHLSLAGTRFLMEAETSLGGAELSTLEIFI
jgi:hypothetical protein